MEGIEKYLEIAKLLSCFFESLGYCKNYCFIKKDNKVMSCCGNEVCEALRIYEWEDKLTNLRNENISGNHYLTKNGCRAGIYKPVVCMTYSCSELSEYAKQKYGVNYEFHDIFRRVNIMSEETDDSGFLKLKKELEGMILIVEKNKGLTGI